MTVDFNDSEKTKEIGQNCSVQFTGGVEVAAENASFSEEAETSEVQYNDSFGRSLAVTGVTYSGSFEVPGNASLERDEGWDAGGGGTTLPKHISTFTITDNDGGREYNFNDAMITSHEKDIPGDDRTSHSFDFEAQTLTVVEP